MTTYNSLMTTYNSVMTTYNSLMTTYNSVKSDELKVVLDVLSKIFHLLKHNKMIWERRKQYLERTITVTWKKINSVKPPLKELSFSNPFIIATWLLKPIIIQT